MGVLPGVPVTGTFRRERTTEPEAGVGFTIHPAGINLRCSLNQTRLRNGQVKSKGCRRWGLGAWSRHRGGISRFRWGDSSENRTPPSPRHAFRMLGRAGPPPSAPGSPVRSPSRRFPVCAKHLTIRCGNTPARRLLQDFGHPTPKLPTSPPRRDETSPPQSALIRPHGRL